MSRQGCTPVRQGQTSHDETGETDRETRHCEGGGLSGEEKAAPTFRTAAKAGPKVALTSTRSRIQAGSFARIGGRAYRWSRSTMLAKSFWCLMALPGWEQRLGLLNLPPQQHTSTVCPPLPQTGDASEIPAACHLTLYHPSPAGNGPGLTYRLVDSLHTQILHQSLPSGGLTWGSGLGRERR